MRRAAQRIPRSVGVALLLALTWAATMSAGAVTARAAGLTLTVDQEGQTEITHRDFGVPGRTWGYWGRLSTANIPIKKWGSYRATCAWLATTGAPEKKRDNRFVCTVVFSAVNGGTLIAQGSMRMPRTDEYLFSRAWRCSSARRPLPAGCGPRPLAITGATTPYKSKLGYAVDLATQNTIVITGDL
jgi:hypothetical protein